MPRKIQEPIALTIKKNAFAFREEMRRAAAAKNRRDYCAGAFVDGVAGALVEGVSGVAVGVSDFWQPVSIPTQTRPNTAANVNNFFMRVELLKNLRRRQAKFSGFGNAGSFRR